MDEQPKEIFIQLMSIPNPEKGKEEPEDDKSNKEE